MALRKFLFLNPTEGFAEEQAATDDISLGKVTAVGVSGVAFDASNQLIINVGTPTAGHHAVNKDYVDAFVQGIDWKESVRAATTANLSVTASGSGVGKTLTATSNGAIVIDGVSLALNNRVLVKNQTVAADNGIYRVTVVGDTSTPFQLTRATDADQNNEVTAGMSVFVTEGTVNGDTGWVLTTNDPITVDTTGLAFTQFSSTVAYTFDQGLLLSSGSVQVELDTTAGPQTSGAGGGSSGLEFDVNNASGKLRAAVNASGGLHRSSSGLAILLANSSLTTTSSGTSVFSSPRIENTLVADEAIAVANPVVQSSTTDGRVVNGRADTDSLSRILGIARTAASGGGVSLQVTSHGPCPGVLSGATRGTPYYLGATGGISTSLPGGSHRVVQVGIATSPTDLFVRIVDYGKKA